MSQLVITRKSGESVDLHYGEGGLAVVQYLGPVHKMGRLHAFALVLYAGHARLTHRGSTCDSVRSGNLGPGQSHAWLVESYSFGARLELACGAQHGMELTLQCKPGREPGSVSITWDADEAIRIWRSELGVEPGAA